MRADDLVHVVILKKLWMWNLTLPLVTNEQSYLREEPIQGHSSLENPEEQEHWVLTMRRGGRRCNCIYDVSESPKKPTG